MNFPDRLHYLQCLSFCFRWTCFTLFRCDSSCELPRSSLSAVTNQHCLAVKKAASSKMTTGNLVDLAMQPTWSVRAVRFRWAFVSCFYLCVKKDGLQSTVHLKLWYVCLCLWSFMTFCFWPVHLDRKYHGHLDTRSPVPPIQPVLTNNRFVVGNPSISAGQSSKKRRFQPGPTRFSAVVLGVIWEPWIWDGFRVHST